MEAESSIQKAFLEVILELLTSHFMQESHLDWGGPRGFKTPQSYSSSQPRVLFMLHTN